jgi:hypothetical protein
VKAIEHGSETGASAPSPPERNFRRDRPVSLRVKVAGLLPLRDSTSEGTRLGTPEHGSHRNHGERWPYGTDLSVNAHSSPVNGASSLPKRSRRTVVPIRYGTCCTD